jgi:hypothetical protein
VRIDTSFTGYAGHILYRFRHRGEDFPCRGRSVAKIDEKLKFVSRFLGGEKIAVLCRQFRILQATGYRIIERYRQDAGQGFTDRSPHP